MWSEEDRMNDYNATAATMPKAIANVFNPCERALLELVVGEGGELERQILEQLEQDNKA